jgi:diguanylate cyclase (GGDEF)-like protein
MTVSNDKPAKSGFLRFGIRQKVLLVLFSVLLLTLSISGWLMIDAQKTEFLNGIDQRGDDISRYMAKSLAFSVVGHDYHTIQLLLDEITAAGDVAYARVNRADGKLMYETGNRLENDQVRSFRQPIVLDEQVIGSLELELSTASTLARLEEQKFDLMRREGLIILIIVIGEFIALSYIIIQPVKKITESFSRMMMGLQGEEVPQIHIDSRDEFGQMADQFNLMGQRLNDAHRKLKHEIEIADQQLVKKNRQLVRQSNELRRMNRELRGLTITDELTGLYNRRHFDEYLGKEIALVKRYNQPTSLLLIDLDFFKNVNDSFGHVFGDSVLRTIAGQLRQFVRSSDVLCRVGGEEFAVLCTHTSAENAIQLAESLRRAISSNVIKVGEQELKITISIGVATLPHAQLEADSKSMYACADRALYYSKQHGRDRVTHCNTLKMEQDGDSALYTA